MTYYDFIFLIISAKDLTDNEELSFYEQCLTNLDVDLHSSSSLPWASLADVGDTIAEFSLNVSAGVFERIYFFCFVKLKCCIFLVGVFYFICLLFNMGVPSFIL